ncbi:MAG: ABC transporter permease [Bacteroidia bacterium]|nr:ABC transporter permease [Bacteroidia bacterium]
MISKKSRNAVNMITGISITGIAIGTLALVVVLSAFNGLSSLVESLYNSFDADLQITNVAGKAFSFSEEQKNEIKKESGVLYYTDVVEGNALIKLNEKQIVATVKGVSSDFQNMSGFDSLISNGKFNISQNNIVVGNGIKYTLDINTNSYFSPLSLYAPKKLEVNSINPEDGLNEIKAYPAGVFSINDEFDEKYVFMNIELASKLLDYKNQSTSIEIGIDKKANVYDIKKNISSILGEEYIVKTREEQNDVLYKTIKSEKLWVFIILTFILIIASFNVIGSVSMLIMEKKKDISTLYYLGASKTLIKNIFLLEAFLITFIGTISGIILGVIICFIQIKFSILEFDEHYIVNAFPIKIKLYDIVLIFIVVMLIGLSIAWYPIKFFTTKLINH